MGVIFNLEWIPMLKKLLICSCITLLSVTGVSASSYDVNKTSCSYVKSKIASTKADMRKNYTEAKGERLRAKLQLLKEQRRDCKRKHYSISK